MIIIVDNNEILWLNEKHIEEGKDWKHEREITINYHPVHKKRRTSNQTKKPS